MEPRRLGRNGPEVSALGLGCMGMSEFYGPADEAESVRTIHRALDLGVNFLDTADAYGTGRNEELVGRAIRDRRDQVDSRHQVRQRARAQRRVSGGQWPAGVREAGLRSQSSPSGAVAHRPVLPAPRRCQHAHRGYGGRHGRSGARRQGAIPGDVGSRAGDHPSRQPGSSDRRIANGVFALGARPGRRNPGDVPGTRASVSSPTARSGAASSRDGSRRRTTFLRTIGGAAIPASRVKTSSATCDWPRPFGRSRARWAALPRSWPWPGCWRRARILSPSPEPNRRAIWKTISGP